MALRHHLRADEDDAVGGGELRERGRERARLRNGVGVEPDPFQLRQPLLELALEALRSRTDARELRRRTRGTRGRLRFDVAAVVAAQHAAAMQHQRDVAVRAAQRESARTTVQRRRNAAAIEQQDRLPSPLGDRAELREQRRGERIPGLAAEIDDAHGRKRSRQPGAELEPLEPLPAFRPGGRAAEDRHRALE